MNRKNSLALIASLVLFAKSSRSQSSGPLISVFKTPTCSCCGKWVEHLKANGFTIKVQEVNSTAAYEKQYRVPPGMESCHTAVVNGYAIEGHVFSLRRCSFFKTPHDHSTHELTANPAALMADLGNLCLESPIRRFRTSIHSPEQRIHFPTTEAR